MSNYFFRVFFAFILGIAILSTACSEVKSSVDTAVSKSDDGVQIHTSSVSPTSKMTKGEQTAVFAGGCFWGLEAVFEHVKGVSDVASGYSGGTAETADYETVSTGGTGHAESVKITYDPEKVTYEQLLKVFFAVAHDPTELNRQGPDTGTQYRSAIFYSNEDQRILAEKYIAEMTAAKTFPRPIVTQIVPLKEFYRAEDYHQNYLVNHPTQPYIVINDQPKVDNLRKQFADLYVSK